MSPTTFAGREVVIVGAGQSALETAALLHEAGARVRVIGRCTELEWTSEPLPGTRNVLQRLRYPDGKLCAGWRCWSFEHLPLIFRRLSKARRLRYIATTFGPRGAYWLRDRLADVPITLGRSIGCTTARDGRVRLELHANDGGATIEVVSTEHVIAATGYRVDLGRLVFIDDALRAAIELTGAMPALSSSFESSVPGLYFVGAASATTFGPVTRFVAGARFAARRVARHAAGDQSTTPPAARSHPAGDGVREPERTA